MRASVARVDPTVCSVAVPPEKAARRRLETKGTSHVDHLLDAIADDDVDAVEEVLWQR